MGVYQCDGEDVEVSMWARVVSNPSPPYDVMWEANVEVVRHDYGLGTLSRTSMNYRWKSGVTSSMNCYATRTLSENSSAPSNAEYLCDAPMSLQLSS